MVGEKQQVSAWNIHPGEILREKFLKPLGISARGKCSVCGGSGGSGRPGVTKRKSPVHMEIENDSNTKMTFAVSVSQDRDGFLRRSCPSCGREFKTAADPGDLQWALSSYCQQIGLEIGQGQPASSTPSRLRCPYCEHEDDSSNMHTEATINYLKRIVYRECAIPMLNRAFGQMEDTLGSRSSSDGFLSISIQFTHHRSVSPVRPIHGPEPADMKIVAFLCCGQKIKVDEGWAGIRVCSFCGTDVVLI